MRLTTTEPTFQKLFHVADLRLNLSANLLLGSLRFEIRLVGRLADLFFNLSLQFVGHALDFVLRAVFHVDDLLYYPHRHPHFVWPTAGLS
jgi:hypothetical protein